MTINELRAFLDKEEAKYTEEDKKYLGEFGHTQILLPHFTRDVSPIFKGWDHNISIWPDITGLGYLMDIKYDD